MNYKIGYWFSLRDANEIKIDEKKVVKGLLNFNLFWKWFGCIKWQCLTWGWMAACVMHWKHSHKETQPYEIVGASFECDLNSLHISNA